MTVRKAHSHDKALKMVIFYLFVIFSCKECHGRQAWYIEIDHNSWATMFAHFRTFLGNFTVLFSNFEIQTIISPWKGLKQEKQWWQLFCPRIQDSKTIFKYKIRQNVQPVKVFRGSLVKLNMACNFQWILRDFKNIYREEDKSSKMKVSKCYWN